MADLGSPSRPTADDLDLMVNSIPQLAWMAQRDGWVFWYNKRWHDYTGRSLEAMEGWGWRSVHHPDHIDRVVSLIQHSWETGDPWEDTFPLLRHDGVWRWFLSRALPVRDETGAVVRWFGTNTDVTDIREAQDQQTELLNELNHRVKNTLAIVQSLAYQTKKSALSQAEFDENFDARLMALSRAHNLLATGVWQGASLFDIVTTTLAPYATGTKSDLITFAGPPVRLGPTVAVTIAMAFHELLANAAKYGSLSTDLGKLSVTWEIDYRGGSRPHVVLTWRETNGPVVVPRSRMGLGSRLLENGVPNETSGTVDLTFAPTGVACVITFPLTAKVSAE